MLVKRVTRRVNWAVVILPVVLLTTNLVYLRSDEIVFSALSQVGGQHRPPVRVEGIVDNHRVVLGKPFVVRVQVTIADGYHINSDHPKDKFLIPTRLVFKNTQDFVFMPAKFPTPIERMFEFSSEKLSVFEGEIQVEVPAVSSKKSVPGKKTLSGSLRYQACDQATCFPPRTVAFEIPVELVK